jgi:hypothetical protein
MAAYAPNQDMIKMAVAMPVPCAAKAKERIPHPMIFFMQFAIACGMFI